MMASLQDCVSRKIPKLLREGMDRDQAVAVAYSMCGDDAKSAGLEVMEWDSLSDVQRDWWVSTMADMTAAGKSTTTTMGTDMPPTTIKRLGGDRVGGYGMVWGNPDQRDLEGQYFTPETYLGEVLGVPRDNQGRTIKAQIPWLFDHTLEELPPNVKQYDDVRDYELGTVDTVKADDIGVWVEAQLKRHDEWSNAVMQLVDRGVLQWSSGSAPLYAKIAQNGEIKSWPVVEWSSTPTPAEPRRTENVRLKHYVNSQDTPTEALTDEAAREKPDIRSTNEHTKEVNKMTLTLNESTARAVIQAYAMSEFDTIKSAIEGLNPVKQGNMIEEALRPLAGELATMAGIDEGMALSYLVAFVAEHATGESEEPVMADEEPVMSDQPALSTDIDKLVDEKVSKAVRAALPTSSKAAHKTGGDVKSFNIVRPRSRHEIEEIKSTGDLIFAISHHRHDLLNAYRAKTFKTYKALGLNPDTAGGYLAPIEQSAEVIELLRDTAKVLPLCRTVPMNRDTMTIARQTGGATAVWVGENSSITASQETLGQITLVAKKLAALVQVSNELVADSDPDVESFIREDIARVLALEVDRAILEGSGLGNQPTGVLNLGVTTTALNAAPTAADLQNAISRVEVANVMEDPTWAWVFNPREKSTFRLLQDARGGAVGTGAYIFSEMGADYGLQGKVPPNLLGYPWTTTTQISPTGSPAETEIYFGQWNDVVVGMRKTLEFAASQEAGTAFQNDQTWIRAIMRLDVNIRHLESIEVLTDVRTS